MGSDTIDLYLLILYRVRPHYCTRPINATQSAQVETLAVPTDETTFANAFVGTASVPTYFCAVKSSAAVTPTSALDPRHALNPHQPMARRNALSFVEACEVGDVAPHRHSQMQGISASYQATQAGDDALHRSIVFAQHRDTMQRALCHEAFEFLVDAVRDLSRGFIAQHFGLHGTREFGHSPIAHAHLLPLRCLKQGHSHRLQGFIAEGRHQHASVDIYPRRQG